MIDKGKKKSAFGTGNAASTTIAAVEIWGE
jgi:ribosomal protein L11 methylase PrmA